MIRRGAIHWARLDKRRPVLVVSPDYRNQGAGDVLAVPCTTVRRMAPTHVVLRRGEGGLPESSAAKCEQVGLIAKTDLDALPLGSPLGPERMAEVERALLFALGIGPVALSAHLRYLLDRSS